MDILKLTDSGLLDNKGQSEIYESLPLTYNHSNWIKLCQHDLRLELESTTLMMVEQLDRKLFEWFSGMSRPVEACTIIIMIQAGLSFIYLGKVALHFIT